MPLSISTRSLDPDVTVVELSGKMTLGQESRQVESLVAGLLADGVRKVVFDVSNVEYIDSAGMGQIAYSAGKILQAKGKCRVSGATGLVLEVFKITRVDSVVPFVDTLEEACASLSDS